MTPADLDAYEQLASRLGLEVPEPLRSWIAHGRTGYPERLDSTFSEFLAESPLALVGHADLEWVSIAQLTAIVTDWLFPEAQSGVAFLPFALSGAGDVYALARTRNGATGCGLIWHDSEASDFEYADVASWAAATFAECLVDLTALTARVADGRAIEALTKDLSHLAAHLSPGTVETLADWLTREVEIRPFSAGPHARSSDVPSLITLQEYEGFAASLSLQEPLTLDITPEWEIETSGGPI